jgi:glycerol-3-phosphate acyltransferase PlsY
LIIIIIISILLIITAYLLGSIPFGYLYAKYKGVDITTLGSGNTGATNIYRQFGFAAALSVFLGDMLKGTLAVVLSEYVFHAPEIVTILVCIAAILGHSKSIFIKFKGGKAVATGVGVILALNPWVALSVFVIWLVIFAVSRIVSLASIVAAASAIPAAYFLNVNIYYFYFILAASLFVIYRHKENIMRLLNGTEKPISRTNKTENK